jgi:hypothetical protein
VQTSAEAKLVLTLPSAAENLVQKINHFTDFFERIAYA